MAEKSATTNNLITLEKNWRSKRYFVYFKRISHPCWLVTVAGDLNHHGAHDSHDDRAHRDEMW